MHARGAPAGPASSWPSSRARTPASRAAGRRSSGRPRCVEELARHFGPRAAKPELIVEGGWVEREWTRGCYNANPGPCGWIHFGASLATPVGPIKWAATETALQWSGYMEGAVDAGQRAAREALADLGEGVEVQLAHRPSWLS